MKSRTKSWFTICLLLALMGPARAKSDTQAHIRGLLDVVFSTDGPSLALNRAWLEDSPFDAYRFRLFAEGRSGEHFEGFTEFMANDAAGVYIYGAWASYTPDPGRDLHILAGKIPWIIGTHDPRAYSNKNPLIGAPLLYQYKTTLVPNTIPRDAASLLSARGHGQTGVYYPQVSDGSGGGGGPGMPVIYDGWWDVGAALQGSSSRFEYSVGFVNGTPGWTSPAEDGNGGKNFLGRLGFTPATGVMIGVSGSYGPYLLRSAQGQVPEGHSLTSYNQELVMTDLSLEYGHAELRGEAYHNVWQTPTVGNLKVDGFYAEGKYTLGGGFYAAARVETMSFSELATGSGRSLSWDTNRNRQEFALGYRVSREAVLKLDYQRDSSAGAREGDPHRVTDLIATQLSLGF